MVALPMRLDEALNLQGYTIDESNVLSRAIATPAGVIEVPAMTLFTLTWQRDRPAEAIDSFYLTRLPVFATEYRPYALSLLLGHYRSRRIGYNTPGEFANAVLRWSGKNLGATSVLNRRWVSTSVALPLDDHDELEQYTRELHDDKTRDESITTNRDVSVNATTGEKTEATTHRLDVGSDFPQSLISGSGSYASAASDQRQADNMTVDGTNEETTADNVSTTETQADHQAVTEAADTRRTGRRASIMKLLAEQRDAFVNVDAEFVDAFEPLMLGVFDRGEGEHAGPWFDHTPWGWARW